MFVHLYTQKIQILYKLTFFKSNIFVITYHTRISLKNHKCIWTFWVALYGGKQDLTSTSRCANNEMADTLPGPACLVPVAEGNPLPDFAYG